MNNILFTLTLTRPLLIDRMVLDDTPYYILHFSSIFADCHVKLHASHFNRNPRDFESAWGWKSSSLWPAERAFLSWSWVICTGWVGDVALSYACASVCLSWGWWLSTRRWRETWAPSTRSISCARLKLKPWASETTTRPSSHTTYRTWLTPCSPCTEQTCRSSTWG